MQAQPPPLKPAAVMATSVCVWDRDLVFNLLISHLISHRLKQYSEIPSKDNFQLWLRAERGPEALFFCRMDAPAALNGSLETL